jgi:hypothetical protein
MHAERLGADAKVYLDTDQAGLRPGARLFATPNPQLIHRFDENDNLMR